MGNRMEKPEHDWAAMHNKALRITYHMGDVGELSIKR